MMFDILTGGVIIGNLLGSATASQGGGSDGAIVMLTDNRTMLASEVGKHFEYAMETSAAKVFTLCAPPINNSAPIWVKNKSAYDITIAGHLNGTASSTFTLQPDSEIKLVSEGSTWRVVMERWEASAASSSHTFAGLKGDTDRAYNLVIRMVSGSNNADVFLRFNNDSSSSNYRLRYWTNTSNGVTQGQGIGLAVIPLSGDLMHNETKINALSGGYRVVAIRSVSGISSSGVGEISNSAAVWYNTADEITSISIVAPFAAGTSIELWKLAQ